MKDLAQLDNEDVFRGMVAYESSAPGVLRRRWSFAPCLRIIRAQPRCSSTLVTTRDAAFGIED